MNKDLDSLINEALQNIRDDRKIARELLNDTANIIAVKPDDSRYLGPVAAKHVETLQRSNEQLEKVSALLQKKVGSEQGLTDEDKSELFDLIKGSENG